MPRKRYLFPAFVIGVCFKTILILWWHVFRSGVALGLLTKYDPLALAFANWGYSLIYGSRGIWPGGFASSEVFEILLVLGFGIECVTLVAILGVALDLSSEPSRARNTG